MLTSCFSFLVILCILVYFYLMLDLHLKNKGIYSPIRHAVSDYGVGSINIFLTGQELSVHSVIFS